MGDICYPGAIRCCQSKLTVHKIGCQQQRMVRVRRCLEFSLLLAAQSELCANPLDATDAGLDAVIG